MTDFFFPHKLARLEFLWRILLSNIVTGPLAFDIFNETITLTGGLVFAVVLLYSVFFIYLPRCRDASISSWFLIFAFLPILDKLLGVLLLFKPGTRRWGSPSVEDPATEDPTKVPDQTPQ